METTEKIVEAYVRYVKGWATIPNLRCEGLGCTPGKLRRAIVIWDWRNGVEEPPQHKESSVLVDGRVDPEITAEFMVNGSAEVAHLAAPVRRLYDLLRS